MDKQTKVRVLVVDPAEHMAKMLGDLLELDGYQALATCDAYAAGLVIESFCPDMLLFTYYPYNEASFNKLLSHCQNYYPILFLCSYRASEHLIENWNLNAESMVIYKPFSVDELMNGIRDLSHRRFAD